MTINDHDFEKIIAEIEAASWSLSETIRVRELATTNRLGKMHCLLMLEEHKAWKREFGFDRIEAAAEMDEKRCRTSTSPVSGPFFYKQYAQSEAPTHTLTKLHLR